MTGSAAAFALAIVMAFAGGWIWRGVWDLWRHPKAKVYGTTHTTWQSWRTGVVVSPPSNDSGETNIVPQIMHGPSEPPRLRAVE